VAKLSPSKLDANVCGASAYPASRSCATARSNRDGSTSRSDGTLERDAVDARAREQRGDTRELGQQPGVVGCGLFELAAQAFVDGCVLHGHAFSSHPVSQGRQQLDLGRNPFCLLPVDAFDP
jgi:hypothetical protein